MFFPKKIGLFVLKQGRNLEVVGRRNFFTASPKAASIFLKILDRFSQLIR
jgi:hypothetical protein